jgi:hypothetical protein
MSIATLTFASFRFASTAPTPAPASTTEPPIAAPAPAAPKADEGCACPPKRNGLADAVKQATGAEDDADGPLRDAVMDFARVLMQALRADAGGSRHGRGDDDGEGGRGHGHRQDDDEGHRSHGHHGRHHRHHRHDDGEGYSTMRSLGDRIQSLAQSLSPATPAAPETPAAPATPKGGWSPATTATVVPLPAPEPEPQADPAAPVDAAADSAAPGWSAEFTVVRFQISGHATPYARMQDKLLEAFDHLRQAQGAPAAADKGTLRSELSNFLEQLASGLGADTADSLAAPTAPGALLDLAA